MKSANLVRILALAVAATLMVSCANEDDKKITPAQKPAEKSSGSGDSAGDGAGGGTGDSSTANEPLPVDNRKLSELPNGLLMTIRNAELFTKLMAPNQYMQKGVQLEGSRDLDATAATCFFAPADAEKPLIVKAEDTLQLTTVHMHASHKSSITIIDKDVTMSLGCWKFQNREEEWTVEQLRETVGAVVELKENN